MTVINPIDDNTRAWAAWFNAFANAHGAGGIVSGCSISKGTGDWDIDVTSGKIIESNTEASISSGTVTITDSSALTSGQSRVTLIHADTGDALASTDGTAATDPTTPDIPSGEVLLGFVIVADTDSTVADSDIFDVPALIQDNSALYRSGGSYLVNEPDWQEDGNSPQTATGTSSDTFTLSGSYDEVLVRVDIEDVSASSNNVALRADGDSGANYNFIDSSGTQTTGANQVTRVINLPANGATQAPLWCSGRFSGTWNGGKPTTTSATNWAVGWSNSNLTSPLDSLTLVGDGNFDVTWNVFGRDVGAAGEP